MKLCGMCGYPVDVKATECKRCFTKILIASTKDKK